MSWLRHLKELLVAAPPVRDATEARKKAVLAAPRDADAHFALGAALRAALKPAEALAAFRAGLALRPDDASMRNEVGASLLAMGRYEEALAELDDARRLAPDLAEVYCNLSGAYHNLGRLDDALDAARRGRDLMPEHPYTHSNLLLILNYSGRHTPAEIYEEHKRFGARFVQPVSAPQPDLAWPRRLRIGYVSPDFRSHVVSTVALPIVSHHDRARFEVFCYFTYPVGDAVTDEFRRRADGWVDCATLSDAQLAERVRADRIDILVDLAGHTAYNRVAAFAFRPAPVQVSYQGYPNTTGLTAMDYRITDPKADPPGDADRTHVERLVRLPRSFMCYRPGVDFPEVGPLPALAGGGVTFGCFNNFQKLSDEFFDAAARVLHAVPRSRLLLKGKQLAARQVIERVHKRFAEAGIPAERLQLRGWETTVGAHFGAYNDVDIALDSFPYNGTTTTCEALWMGVPVVGLHGGRHAARVGASLLETVGLGELVARDVEDYAAIAARLAADLPQLAALRAGMRERMRASPLMDERGHVRALEECFEQMWQAKREAAAVPALSPAEIEKTLQSVAALRTSGQAQEAKEACARILGGQPAHAQALGLMWDLCHETGDDPRALDWLGRALADPAASPQVHYMLGRTLQDLERREEAIESYRAALHADPGHAKAANNLGAMLEAGGELEQAARSYGEAVRADPGLANAHYNLGNVRKQLGQQPDAEASFRRALALAPGQAEWIANLGESLLVQWKLDEALACQREALALDPSSEKAQFGLANTLLSLGRTGEAEESFLGANARQVAEPHSNLLLCLHYRKGDDGPLMLAEHLEWARRHASELPRMPLPPGLDRSPERRLNVGYLSPDFRRHAVAWATEPFFAAHDRSRFRVFFYANVAQPDAMTQRFRALCDEWRDVHRLSSEDTARLVRADRIDILIDLAGHTGGGRPLVLARKPAPVQVAWQGYPNTTGLSAVDYRFTDAHADPEGDSDRHHVEKLVRLSTGFFCYAPPPDAPEVGDPPSSVSGRVTFGCFNNLAKVTPETIRLWSTLLKQAPQARMLLKAPSLGADSARRYVLELFAQNGVEAQRIELLRPEDTHAAHLRRYRDIDIALDPFPYHGTATTCEALWMGVPVVTLAGRTHVSRVGVSILRRLGLQELIADTPQAYIEKAVALASDAERLRALHGGMRARMRASALLDPASLAQCVQAAYRDMWRRWCEQNEAAALDDAAGGSGLGGGEPLRFHLATRQRLGELEQLTGASMNEVYVAHVLEHLEPHDELPRTLGQLYRVLKPGGIAKVSAPDADAIGRLLRDPRLAAQERAELVALSPLTAEALTRRFFEAGFSRVERVKRFALDDAASAAEVFGMPVCLHLSAYK